VACPEKIDFFRNKFSKEKKISDKVHIYWRCFLGYENFGGGGRDFSAGSAQDFFSWAFHSLPRKIQ
jgi:hypothetical protein